MGAGLALKVVDDWQGRKANGDVRDPPAKHTLFQLVSMMSCLTSRAPVWLP